MILRLTLKKKWFDMILSGEKKEEYREIKSYWIQRFSSTGNLCDDLRDFLHIEFRNGYGKNAPLMVVEFEGIEFGYPKPEWSDGGTEEVFVIKLGRIISTENINY